MSRIGRLPIKLPENVTVNIGGDGVEITGKNGNLKLKLHPAVKAELKDNVLSVILLDDEAGNIHGLTRSLLFNMVKGVTEGWSKNLELSGTGFKAILNGSELQLSLGFSHPVNIKAPEGIKFEVKENKITISGPDKMLVGEIAAKIRSLKPADPYKLKGFKYEGEVIIKKAGKAAKAGA
jgi:large subunit ribosomal protein L6